MTNRYDELSDRARWFMENFDELDLAELCASKEASAARAEAAIDRVRVVLAERRAEVAEREADGMLPFGTPGASWCDAVTVTCARIDDALRIFPPPAAVQAEPAPHDGPTVAECRADDRAHWDAKYAGEGQ